MWNQREFDLLGERIIMLGMNMTSENTHHNSGVETDPAYCPAYATLNLLNKRWNLHIVRALLDGKKRFNELSRERGINPRTLSCRLRFLEEEGLVTRTVV